MRNSTSYSLLLTAIVDL